MKTSIITSLIASAAAFAPSQKATSNTALSANKFASELGAQAPLGFFDPIGVLATEDDSKFTFLREAEIKHGRIAQLAVVGYLTTYAGYRIPGMEDVPSGLGVFNMDLYTSDLARANIYWTIGTMVLLETVFVKDAYGLSEFPGNYLSAWTMNGHIRWEERSDEFKISSRAKELNNGRAAMMGILGLVVHEGMGNVDELLPYFN